MAIETPSRSSSSHREEGLDADPGSSSRRGRQRPAASFLVIGLILAMGGFGLTFYLGTQLASSTPTVSVLIAAHDIQAGSSITSSDLTTKKYLSESAPKSVLHSQADATGHIARVEIAAGDPVLSSMVGSLSQGIAPVSLLPVPPGYVAVQFGAPAGRAVSADYITGGSFIDIIASANLSLFKPGANGLVSRVVFHDIEVLNAFNSSPGTQGGVNTLTVLMDECDLPYFTWFIDNATVYIAALPPQQGGLPAADTTCPGLVSDQGIGAAAVNARYKFTG